MYVQITENNKCSKCGTMNHTESVTREMKTFIRCMSCGHEKLTSTLTVTDNRGEYTRYDANSNEVNEF